MTIKTAGMKMGFMVEGKVQELEVTPEIMYAAFNIVGEAMAFYKAVDQESTGDGEVKVCEKPMNATGVMHACHKFEEILMRVVASKLGLDPEDVSVDPNAVVTVGKGVMPKTEAEAVARGFMPLGKRSKHDLN